jgi:hypothetical protein
MLNVGKKRALERGKIKGVRKLALDKLYVLLRGLHLKFVLEILLLFRNEHFLLNVLGLGEEKSLIWVEGDAEALSFKDNSLDGYTIAFGIRNVTHIEKVLAEAYR